MVRLVPSEDLRGFVGVDRVKVRKGEVESVRRRATQSRVMFQTMNWAVSARCGLNSPVSRSAESWIAGVARSSICRGLTFCFVTRRAETTCSTSVARSRVKPESATLPTAHSPLLYQSVQRRQAPAGPSGRLALGTVLRLVPGACGCEVRRLRTGRDTW